MDLEIKKVFRTVVEPTEKGWNILTIQTGTAACSDKLAKHLTEIEPHPQFPQGLTFSFFEGEDTAHLIERAKTRCVARLDLEIDYLLRLKDKNPL